MNTNKHESFLKKYILEPKKSETKKKQIPIMNYQDPEVRITDTIK